MSHYRQIRAELAIMTAARYVCSDISARTIETMIDKWWELMEIIKAF